MAFKFRYETLLSYRQHLKEKAEIELSKARHRLLHARDQLENYKKSLHDANGLLREGLRDRILSSELKSYSDYISGMKIKIEEQRKNIAGHEKIVEEKISLLMTKTKEHKAIEKLKEKDFEKWEYQQHLMERKQMNEVAVVRFGREPF